MSYANAASGLNKKVEQNKLSKITTHPAAEKVWMIQFDAAKEHLKGHPSDLEKTFQKYPQRKREYTEAFVAIANNAPNTNALN